MPIAPGYFLTWHTYGTWLHGDAAGSVDKKHNEYGSPRLVADPRRLEHERMMLKHPPTILSPIARVLVDAAVREHCRVRAWDLRALAVRSNHVHVVIAEPEVAPEPIVKQLKEWGTRRLRSHRVVGPRERVWADHGSTVYLFEPGSLEAACEYVLAGQEKAGEMEGREGWWKRYGVE